MVYLQGFQMFLKPFSWIKFSQPLFLIFIENWTFEIRFAIFSKKQYLGIYEVLEIAWNG